MNFRAEWIANTEQLLLSKLLQRVASIPADVFLFFSSLSIIEQQVLYPRYQAFLQQYQPYLPTLDPQDLVIVQELEATGISITSLENLDLPNTNDFFTSAQDLGDELAQMSKYPEYKLKHTLSASAEQVMRYPDVFLWGAQERLLRIVERYLNLPVAYDGLSYYYSIANNLEAGPRKWHRDKEDWRMIKIGVYINNVDCLGGPFECVFPAANIKIRNHANQKYQVFQECELKKILGEDPQTWRKSCVGAKGTVIFVDTAAYYHRGKPPISVDRSAIFFSYFSLRPKHPFFCGRSPLSQSQLAQLSQNLSDHVRQSILWRNDLPGIGGWIPKNYLKV